MNILREVDNLFDKYCTHQNIEYTTNDVFNLKIEIAKLINGNKDNPIPSKLSDYDKETLKYAEECIQEELSLEDPNGFAYKDLFRPRWEKFLKKFNINV